MAQNLQLLRRRIKTSKNIAQIAKAMEMISASKIKKAQEAVQNNKPYAQRILDFTTRVSRNTEQKISHPYLETNESEKKLIIAFSPDRGLCGGLNTSLSKLFLQIPQDDYVITNGKRAGQFISKTGIQPVAAFDSGTTLPSYERVYQLVELINEYYLTKKVSKVEVIYPDFVSFFTQTPTQKTILPLEIPSGESTSLSSYIFEPNAEKLLLELLPYYLEINIYSILLEAYTSEQAARMMAMQNAKNNALDIAEFLTLSYNKSRQEKITNEILDLNSGQL
ncbi:MAG: ATP synthase F1 subunit gamma [Candidatus Levybacteria bacterium]|nr:ATP synthase F1 subunit gamma [Candidatus Levybacteria bacterium]